ncbi:hypothetical protein CQ040_16310 [Microbacterium sp. MYb54]|nr:MULTISPECIES: hypothetical protein [unclassified Microbacterium]PQZ53141.1 hypothetical protein CQ032_15660 [Microbacterium sp. MYb43]PQZ74683.1 hypothetical protein CQ031_15005 [Microbacterium sp. MYb40]PRB18771.1 hypothetical protein CQ040_16310 [Microbacterium sp. MYb54]PRB23631.1 hypothetical protein CQ037_17110 [Microbacterium sp. MYb50]PRB63360.1 hypothetical protein CQ021_16795 [Microbacterium sp. MYb24]
MNTEQLREAVAHSRPFSSTLAHGESIAVLGTVRPDAHGPLAELVRAAQRDYTEQYLTGGSRKRYRRQVAYYVTTADGYVLGYTAADGTAVSCTAATTSVPVLTAVREGLADTKARGIYHEAREFGMHPPGYIDGEEAIFTLWERDPSTPVQEATVTRQIAGGTLEARREAYEAMRAADRLGQHIPASERNHAWVTREPVGTEPPATWGEHQRREAAALSAAREAEASA